LGVFFLEIWQLENQKDFFFMPFEKRTQNAENSPHKKNTTREW
jgi:hypothetical protein